MKDERPLPSGSPWAGLFIQLGELLVGTKRGGLTEEGGGGDGREQQGWNNLDTSQNVPGSEMESEE